jgi:hypothetical protein
MRLFRLSLGFVLFCSALVLAAVPAKQAGSGSVYAEAVAFVSVSSDASGGAGRQDNGPGADGAAGFLNYGAFAPGPCCAGGADDGAPAGNSCGHISCSSPACDIADNRAGSPRSAFRRAPLVVASWRTLALVPDPRPPRAIGRIV